MYAKNVVKYVEISQRKTREVLDEHLVDCETTITLDKARANKYKLPEACLRNFDESHVIRTMIKNLRRGSFSVGALIFNPFDSFVTLQKKPMFLPPEFESLICDVSIVARLRHSIPSLCFSGISNLTKCVQKFLHCERDIPSVLKN